MAKVVQEKSITQLRNEWKDMKLWADTFRFGTIATIIASLIVFTFMEQDTVKGILLYWAGAMFLTGTIGFILGWVEISRMNKYFEASAKRMRSVMEGEDDGR